MVTGFLRPFRVTAIPAILAFLFSHLALGSQWTGPAPAYPALGEELIAPVLPSELALPSLAASDSRLFSDEQKFQILNFHPYGGMMFSPSELQKSQALPNDASLELDFQAWLPDVNVKPPFSDVFAPAPADVPTGGLSFGIESPVSQESLSIQ